MLRNETYRNDAAQAMKPENPSSTIKVLLIEDNRADARLVREMLTEADGTAFDLEYANRLSAGLERLAIGGIDALLLDLSLPDSLGLDTFIQACTHAPQVPIIVLSGQDDQSLALKAVAEGAQDYLVKWPSDGHLLVRSIRYAIERCRLMRELEETRRQQLEIKDQFLSHVSHELRSPLTAIYQFVTILLDGLAGDLSHEQRDYLNIVLKNVKQLQTMIGELLEVTRAETGKLSIDPRGISPVAFIAETLAMLLTTAVAKGVALSADLPGDLPPVYADPQRLTQILVNLVDNAIKFTPAGGNITVRARVFEQDPTFLCVAVADTGSGISLENTQRIFDRLYQETRTTEAGRKGLGLGLYICKELVGRHGGRIWVESQPGKGSVFYFTLPIFSLARLLFPVITENGRLRESIALISVEIYPIDEASPTKVGEHLRREAWNALQRCILSRKNMLLPRITSTGESELFFVVQCSDQNGAAMVAEMISEQLRQCQDLQDPNIGVAVSTTMVKTPSSQSNRSVEELVEEVATEVEELMQATISKKAKEARKDLYGVMSRELRNPLSIIMGYGGILQDKLLGNLNPEQESALGKVMDHTKDLLVMINNILEVQRIEARALKVERHEVSLTELLADLKSTYDDPWTKALSLTWDYPLDLPVIITDGNKLKLILQNLVHNAVKFTEKGGVIVSVRLKKVSKQITSARPQAIEDPTHGSRPPTKAAPKWVEFKVQDTGIGIPPECMPAIFDRFRQLQTSEINPLGGMGLGLYIVKSLTELMGGKVDVESRPGKGSVFKVTLPVQTA